MKLPLQKLEPHGRPPAKQPRARAFFRLAALAGLSCVWLSGAQATAKLTLDMPIVVTQLPTSRATPIVEPPAAGLVRSNEFDGAQLAVVSPEGGVRVLSEGFHSACDPNVSFDGQKILFAGRKAPAGPWRIWEIGVDGSGLRAITPEGLEARHPIYVSSLFTLNSPQPWQTFVFAGRPATAADAGRPAAWNLYNIKLDGTELRRLTYTPHSSVDPFQMWDGRVVYAAERHPQEPSADASRVALFALHIEGADVELYGGELGRRIQQMPCATEGGLVVFVETAAATADGAGELAWVEQRRPHKTYRVMKPDGRSYRYPVPLENNQVLVSQRDARGKGRWSLVRFDADTGAVSPVFASKDHHVVQAVPLRARRAPDGHSTVVTTEDNYGTLYGLDCYTTDAARSGQLKPGEIKRIRLIEGIISDPASASAPLSAIPRRLIGEAAVEADGSFNLFVPSDTPLQLQTIDEHGLSLGTCGWIWVKPKEKRGCIGCHEDPERVPENKFMLALHHDSVRLTPAVAERRTVTFTRDIVPLLQRLPQLLDARNQPLRLRLDTPAAQAAAYQTLTQGDAGLVHPGRARTSPLIWQLFGRNTSRPWDPTARAADDATASSRAPLSEDELRTVILWIDLGAAYESPASPAATEKEIAGK